jgi:HlyD family secretion protein
VVAPRKSGWRRWVALAIVAAGAGVVAYRVTRPKAPIHVETVRVARGQVREMIPSASAGTVEPARRVIVRAEIAGTVAEVRAHRGVRLAESAVVIVFRADELDARTAQAQANIDAAQVSISIAKERHTSAKSALDRAQKLAKGGAISSAELERAESEAAAFALGVDQAAAAEKQAQAALRLAKVSRDRAIVRAPFAGVLHDVAVEVGVQAVPGAALFDLIDDSSVHLVIPVDESDAAKISLGQSVEITTDARRDETIGGVVTFIPPAVGRASFDAQAIAVAGKKERSVYVEVKADDPSKLRVGASVNAEFLVRAKDDVLFVPSRAVIGRGVKREVYLVRDGKAKKVQFQAGLTSWDRTEIVSGLSASDEVVATLAAEKLEDGAPVDARPVAEAQPHTQAQAP